MKTVISLLIIISTLGCKENNKLNNEIYEVQKQAVLHSPYKSASGTNVYVEAQKNFRARTLPKLLKNKIFSFDHLSDTVFITETFDAICINCPSYWMKVLIKDTIYSVRSEILGHKGEIGYNVEAEPFDPSSKDFQYELRNSELIEIVCETQKGNVSSPKNSTF